MSDASTSTALSKLAILHYNAKHDGRNLTFQTS